MRRGVGVGRVKAKKKNEAALAKVATALNEDGARHAGQLNAERIIRAMKSPIEA